MKAQGPIVIVGAAPGGPKTAEAERRATYPGRVVLIGDEVHALHNRPPLAERAELAEHLAFRLLPI